MKLCLWQRASVVPGGGLPGHALSRVARPGSLVYRLILPACKYPPTIILGADIIANFLFFVLCSAVRIGA